MAEYATCLPDWPQLHRLVPSHFPPINLFESVADPDELEIVHALESLTNDRLRQEAGELWRVPPQDRISGPGSSPVMAAFTHIGIASRFTDGSFGAYYGARELRTAIAETVYHRERFLSATEEPDTELTMRQYINSVALPMHDIRGNAALHDPDDYRASQQEAERLRKLGSHGLMYHSVRDPGGECIAALRPTAVTIPAQGGHFRYVWSGFQQRIVSVLTVDEFNPSFHAR